MSRIGKKPVVVPAGVTVELLSERELKVKGPKGELTRSFRPEVALRFDEAANSITVECLQETRVANAMHGLTRALVQNMVTGVATGFAAGAAAGSSAGASAGSADGSLSGSADTAYLAAVQGNVLQVRVGFANEIHKEIPAGLEVKCPDQMHIHITGCDKQLVGQFAAEVRAVRKAEPYLGKGIKYEGEVIRRKESKAAGKK